MALKKAGYKSIKARFISYIIQIFIVSPIITLVLIIAAVQLLTKGLILPADYYESEIPKVRELIGNEQNDMEAIHDQLEKMLPQEEMGYKVVGTNGEVLYMGGLSQKITTDYFVRQDKNKEQSYTKGMIKPFAMKYLPIERAGKYEGAVILGYWLANSSELPVLKTVAPYFNLIIYMLPLVVVIGTLLFYARRFVKALEEPVAMLQEGISRLQERDLDFELDCTSQDEIGQLCTSFEHMREALKTSLEENWQKAEERKRIISGLSHDLRTPVTVIKGHTELILEDELTRDQLHSSAYAIQKNADRLTRLVQSLNEVNKLQQVELMGKAVEINLDEFFKEKLGEYDVLAKERKINIQYESEGTNQLIPLNVDAWSQILDNLMSNSLRFTPLEGKILVRVELKEQQFELKVEDSGCGFKDEDIKQGLNLFYQGDKSRNSGQHYGIGLYIVDYFVKKMSGNTELYQSQMGGAGIRIYINNYLDFIESVL